jgi:hypothetical protein
MIRARTSSNSITISSLVESLGPCGLRTSWANRTTGPTVAAFSRRRRDDQHLSELVVNPCRLLYASAVSPLARHPAIRWRQIVAVSDIARSSDPAKPS